MVRESIGISEDTQTIYARCMRDTLIAVSADGRQYELNYARHLDFGYDLAPSMLVEEEGTVFFPTMKGLICAVKAKNGTLIWKHKIENNLIHTLAPLDKNRVIFANLNGKVGLLGKQ
jgi:outer membrane protein assembly factor BamB